MTLEELISRIRNLARIDSYKTAESVLITRIEDAIRQLSIDVKGWPKEEYPKLAATFDTNTDMRINVTITGGANALAATDVAITSTDREAASGDTVASDLQTALNNAVGGGDLTVSFSNFYFTIDTTASSASTAITIAAPDKEDYLDASDLLGMDGSLTASSGSFTSGFPTGCTRRVTLDREPLTIKLVEWDRAVIEQAPRRLFARELYSGDPSYYYQEGNVLLITPAPTQNTGEGMYVAYKAMAELDTYSAYQECGLTGKTYTTATGLSASTLYYFKVTYDDQTQTEYSITTTANTTYAAVIDLMNDAVTGVTFSLESGDLRCTSNTGGSDSYVALAAGTTGTDLFGALTGFSAFETAVVGTSTLPDEIPASLHEGLANLVASNLLRETFEDTTADKRLAIYWDHVRRYLVNEHNKNTAMSPDIVSRLWWRYGGRDD